MMNELADYLKQNNINFTEKEINQLNQYMELILERNKKINLTAIKDRKEFVQKHYLDSLLIYNLEEYKNATNVIDIGTGGGFPGIPLAIMSKNKKFTLVDSLNKRLKIIEEFSKEICINNVKVVHGRAEELGQNKNYRAKYDICVSRAVAKVNVLSELCLPFVKKNGYFLAYKGPKVNEELKEGSKAINILGGKIIDIKKFNTDNLEHNIVIIKKIKDTNKIYPRKAGTLNKNPL